jgi:hypothetical protein
LHDAVFDAFDRFDEHLYEFQFGKGPNDPKGKRYVPDAKHDAGENVAGDVAETTIGSLGLKVDQAFGYSWPFKAGWKSHLDTPGAAQMAHLKSLFESLAWYDLVPDQAHGTLTAGYGTMITDKDHMGGVDSNDYARKTRLSHSEPR